MELVMSKGQRLLVGTVFPALIVVMAVVPWVVTWGDLPDPMAIHFARDGSSDGSMPLAVQVAFQLVLSLPAAVVLAWVVRRPGPLSALYAGIAVYAGVLSGWVWVSLAFANRGHDDWHEVTLGSGAFAGAMASAIGFVVPVMMMTHRATAPTRPLRAAQLALGADERAVWFGHADNLGLRTVGAVVATYGISWAILGNPLFGFVTALVGVTVFGLGAVDVTVSREGLRVRSGSLHWPRVEIPLAQVETASAVDLKPAGWGGWGYRGSLRLLRRAAWLARRGEGLEVKLTDGRSFAVSVDDAAEAAEVLNGLLARATPRPG